MKAESTDEQSELFFRFDSTGRRTEDSEVGNGAPLDSSANTEGNSNILATEHKRIDSFVKRCCCHRCVICLLISLTVLILALATIGIVVSLNLNVSPINSTQLGEESEFLDTWEAPEELKENARSYFGKDKNNLTIWFMDSGRWDWEELLKTNSSRQDMDTYIDQNIYRIQKTFKLTNNNDGLEANATWKWVLVSNMDGYSLAQSFNFKATAYMQEMLTRHLPHFKLLDYAIIINMPSWSRFLAGLISPILGDTMDKFEFYGYEDWLPRVLEKIDANELPEGYGAYVSDDDDGWF